MTSRILAACANFAEKNVAPGQMFTDWLRAFRRALRNGAGITSRSDIQNAAERREECSHAEHGNEAFRGHSPFGVETGKSFPLCS
jgi:hypothetical protein